MQSRLYGDLVAFYPLLDPLGEHEAEAGAYAEGILRHLPASEERPTLLEMGSGAGNNAVFMKRDFDITLADLAPQMVELGRSQNPECDHIVGDMRTMAVGKTFDAVFIHDAICYMTTEDDLRAVLQNAWNHTRPGGVAAFAPDLFVEDFCEARDIYDAGDQERTLMGMEWMWSPSTADHLFYVDYAFFLREGDALHALTERHEEGMFPRETWMRLLADIGFEVNVEQRPLDAGEETEDDANAGENMGDEDEGDEDPLPYTPDFFVCKRPA